MDRYMIYDICKDMHIVYTHTHTIFIAYPLYLLYNAVRRRASCTKSPVKDPLGGGKGMRLKIHLGRFDFWHPRFVSEFHKLIMYKKSP